MKIKKWIRPTLFTLGGALAGLAYYYFIGCKRKLSHHFKPIRLHAVYGRDWLVDFRGFRRGMRQLQNVIPFLS